MRPPLRAPSAAAAAEALAIPAAEQMTTNAAPTAVAAVDVPAIPSAKRKRTTTANGKRTLAQFMRYEAMLVKQQEEERGCHAVAALTFLKIVSKKE